MTTPVTHVEESMKLEADAEVDLYKLVLRNTSMFFFRNGPTITWQGEDWEYYPCNLTGEDPVSGESDNRPTFTVFNHENIFGPLADSGAFDLALLYRYRVLRGHLEANTNIFSPRLWLLGRVKMVNNRSIQFELRSPLDIPNFLTPSRTYSPPEFPTVNL